MRFLLLAVLLPAFWAAPVVRVKHCPVVLPTDAAPRIVGGSEASPRTRSHVVSFYEEGCGGSLLSDMWVLTAAHCLVHDGSMARISGTNSSNGVEIPVKRVIDHPDYEFPVNDITLVELEFPAPSSASFMVVNSNPSIPEDGEYARVAGYGFQEEGFDFDHDAMLRQVDVPVMNTQKCIDRYISVNSYLREDISLTKHICAGYDVGGCDSCTADSGGPLFVYDSQDTPVQIAIVSFGYGCAREVPGGYTRVSTYASWMKSVGAVFTQKTSRVARFGDSSSGEEVDDSQTEEKEEQIDEIISEPRPEGVPVPSPAQSSNAVTSSVPLPLDQDTSEATPDETVLMETPSTSQTSPKPSPPARLPPHIAVSPPPSNGKPSFPQGGHGGEGNPRPEISGSATEEPIPTEEDEYSEGAGSTDGSDSDSDISDAMADESEEDRPEEPETDTVSSEEEYDGSDGFNRESATGTGTPKDDFAAAGDGGGPGNAEKDPDAPHQPATPNPEDGPSSADAQPTQSENENGSVSESENNDESSTSTNSGSETDAQPTQSENENGSAGESENNDESSTSTNSGSETGGGEGEVIEDDNSDDSGDGILNTSEDGSESNGTDESETTDPGEVPSPGEIENGADQPVSPMYSPGPSLRPLIPPSETIIQDFEELEPSGSAEVTESPEASSASFDSEGGGLGALPISLIAIGSVLILSIVGYLIYYIASRRE